MGQEKKVRVAEMRVLRWKCVTTQERTRYEMIVYNDILSDWACTKIAWVLVM